MLDTNICIYIAKNKPIAVLKNFKKLQVGQVGMSVITHGELLLGAEKSKFQKDTMLILENLIEIITPIPIALEVAKIYAKIRSLLEQQGNVIGNNDLWIAAHCLSLVQH